MKKLLALLMTLAIAPVWSQTTPYNTFASGLTNATTQAGTEKIVEVQSGASVGVTPSQIATYVNGALPSLWTCSANQIVFDNASGVLACSVGLAWTDSTGT